MSSEGAWPDINYTDKGRTEWAPTTHWSRLVEIAAALHHPGCETGGTIIDAEPSGLLLSAMERGLGYWKKKNFLDPNCKGSSRTPRLVLRELLPLVLPPL